MRVRVLLQITADDGAAGAPEEVASFEKRTERPEDLGLAIAEAKTLLTAVQERTVKAQAASWARQHRRCPVCGAPRRAAPQQGKLPDRVPHAVWRSGSGQPAAAPLPLPGRRRPGHDLTLVRPHPRSRRAGAALSGGALVVAVPYAAATDLLGDILPIASGANATTVREHTLRVAERIEAELGEERFSFIDGCAADWQKLSIPEGRIVVGLDGGYVRNWADRKSNFEVIVGQSLPEDRDAHYVGLEMDYPHLGKFARAVQEFAVYVGANSGSLINYGERFRNGERISSCLAESTVNAVISKRFAKRQQMQWTQRGAHLLLQTRTRALDGTLRSLFERWYTGLANDNADGVAA